MEIMDILTEIGEAKGAKKVKVLAKHKDNATLKRLFHQCYGKHNYLTRKLIPIETNEQGSKDYETLFSVLDKLETVRGKKVLEEATEVVQGLHHDLQSVFNLIISGNLRVGIGATAGNKVWGKNFIERQAVMLLSPYCPKRAAKIAKKGGVVQVKSDGVRCITEVSPTGVRSASRQNEEFHGLDRLADQCRRLALSIFSFEYDTSPVNIDGELCVIEDGKCNPSKASGITDKLIHGTATQEEINSLVYIVWDMYSESDDDEAIYSSRLADLESAMEATDVEDIQLVQYWYTNDLEDVVNKYREVVESGNEGVVLKSVANLWADKRVTDCIKYKEKHQAEFRVTGAYLGHETGNMKHLVGGLHIQSEDGKVVTNTGSGLSLIQRGAKHEVKEGEVIYQLDAEGNYIPEEGFDIEMYNDMIWTIEYNKRTQVEGRETFSLRHPVVKAFRHDKDAANTLEEIIEQEAASLGLRV